MRWSTQPCASEMFANGTLAWMGFGLLFTVPSVDVHVFANGFTSFVSLGISPLKNLNSHTTTHHTPCLSTLPTHLDALF